MAQPEKKRKPRKQYDAVGGEPVIHNPEGVEFVRALNWFNNQWTPDNAKKWIVGYMTKNKYSKDDIATVSGKVRKLIPTTASLARLYTNGSTIDPKYHATIKQSIDTVLDSTRPELDDDGNPVIVNKVSKPKAVPSEMLEFMDDLIARSLAGEKIKVDFYKTLMAMKATKFHLDELTSEYSLLLEELNELTDKEDEQLLEGYNHVSWKAVKQTIELLTDMNTQFKQIKAVTKSAARKPRAKKPPKVEKIIGRLKYQKENAEFRIASIDPAKLLGAKYLVAFNSKTRDLSLYYANEGGFSVKGTSIINFDETKSFTKKLRKPLDILPHIDTRINAERQFKQLKTEGRAANGRMNDTTILYKVW
jgi:hypothetical protein